jgi:hypothetical protein
VKSYRGKKFDVTTHPTTGLCGSYIYIKYLESMLETFTQEKTLESLETIPPTATPEKLVSPTHSVNSPTVPYSVLAEYGLDGLIPDNTSLPGL